MRLPLLRAATAAICLTAATFAQQVQVYNFDGPRRASNLVLFRADMAAGVTVVHGQPEWKKEYDGMLDMLKGKTHRLGKDLWTTFMTSAPVQLGDVTVAPGCYCCGLHCDKDGEFSLAMIDATRAMKKGLLPFGPQTWKPELMVPMKFGKGVVKGVVETMQIKLMGDAEDKMKGSFVIYWGTHALSAPMRIAPADK